MTKFVKCAPTIVFLLLCSSCAAENFEKFEPIFSGMPSGVVDKEQCIRFSDYAVRIEESDMYSQVTAYSGGRCNVKSKNFGYQMDFDSQMAGVWRSFLVIDQGTGADERNLLMLNIGKGDLAHDLTYVLDPEFSSEELIFFTPEKQLIEASECTHDQEEALSWSTMGLGIGMARKVVFNAETGKIKSENDVVCYPIQ